MSFELSLVMEIDDKWVSLLFSAALNSEKLIYIRPVGGYRPPFTWVRNRIMYS
jgi:hypothetical protein